MDIKNVIFCVQTATCLGSQPIGHPQTHRKKLKTCKTYIFKTFQKYGFWPKWTSPWDAPRKMTQNAMVKPDFRAMATHFVNMFAFLYFLDQNGRHHEARLEKWCRTQWLNLIFEPWRPISWTFLCFLPCVYFDKFQRELIGHSHLETAYGNVFY